MAPMPTRAPAVSTPAAMPAIHPPERAIAASERYPCALPCRLSAGSITLLLARIGHQRPQAGLQGGTTCRVGQPPPRQLLGLRHIPLIKANLGQTIQDLRLPRRNPQRALQTGGRTTQITTAFLLTCRGQQRQYRAR